MFKTVWLDFEQSIKNNEHYIELLVNVLNNPVLRINLITRINRKNDNIRIVI